MAECIDPINQNLSAAFPNNQLENSGSIKVQLCETGSTIFNPNYVLSALQTFNTFNNVANQMFGIEARWFRAIPQQRSKDVMFKEYTLSYVEDTPLCLKVVVPDGNFPDSKYQYDLMGLEYEIPLEIQIDKKYWEDIAGFGTAPQKKDIVYLVIPNKLYQVESSYLKRAFMEQETTWVINLKKYQPEASRKESDILKETIDKYTVSEEELFGLAQNAEYKKLTDDKQMSPFNSTERDKYKTLDPDLKIIASNLDIYGTIVSESFYDMKTSTLYNAIEYKNPIGDKIKNTYDRSIVEWVMPLDNSKEYDVIWIQKDLTITQPANYKIKIKGTTKFNLDDTFVISRPGALNFYAKVIDDNNATAGIYYCKIDETIEKYLLSIKSDWINAKGFKMKVKNPISILNGINENNTGFVALLQANQFIKVTYGSQEYITCLPEKLNNDEWYGIVINIGNSWEQYNVYIWETSLDSNQKIKIKFYETMRFVPEYVSVDKYVINKSDSYITNIRLFKCTIEEEKQSLELLSYFSKDGDQLLIGDNADIKFNGPYISKQK